MDLFKIATWNVNSIRARLPIVSSWIESENPDILLLQETKCIEESFPLMDFVSMGYNVSIVGQKSYNGVAILSKRPLQVECNHLPSLDIEFADDAEARYIEAIITVGKSVFRIASIYIPNGGSTISTDESLEETRRFRYKVDFFDRLINRIQKVYTTDEYIVLGGDLNVAHNEIDLYNPEQARNDVGFHYIEREKMSSILDCGFYDAFRAKYPQNAEYSWWDYRRNSWEMNKGWRLDYLFLSHNTKEMLIDCKIDKSQRSLEKTSDHVPIVTLFNIK